MGLIDSLFRGKKAADARPVNIDGRSPLAVSVEIQHLVDAGALKQALELAEKGAYEFPRSELLLNNLRFIKKESLQAELADLKGKLEQQPNPVQYCRLADAYKEIGDYDKALELCRKAIEEFPEHEGPWIIFGKIRIERFKEDWIAKDALLAIQHYEKAVELNRTSYKTLMDLTELFTEVGAKRRARKKCEQVLDFAPEDRKALALLQKIQQMQELRREDVEEFLKAYADRKRKAAQRRGKKPGEHFGPSQRLLKDPVLFQKKLETLHSLPGFYAGVGMDLTGAVIAGYSARTVDYDAVARAVGKVFESAIDCSLRMDIGQFKRGVFEGESGIIFLIVFDEVRIVALCDPVAKREKVEDAVTRFVEDELYR